MEVCCFTLSLTSYLTLHNFIIYVSNILSDTILLPKVLAMNVPPLPPPPNINSAKNTNYEACSHPVSSILLSTSFEAVLNFYNYFLLRVC